MHWPQSHGAGCVLSTQRLGNGIFPQADVLLPQTSLESRHIPDPLRSWCWVFQQHLRPAASQALSRILSFPLVWKAMLFVAPNPLPICCPEISLTKVMERAAQKGTPTTDADARLRMTACWALARSRTPCTSSRLSTAIFSHSGPAADWQRFPLAVRNNLQPPI